jgi:long-chain fatty acid transport protein
MSRQNQYKGIVRIIAMGALAGISSPVWSAGYQLMEQNVTNLGTAYAGTASLAIDASTGFYNSAGLTRICQEQIAFSLVGIKTTAKVNVTSATDTAGRPVTGLPRAGKVQGDGLAPGLHYAYRFNDCFVFGLNIVMPFGLKTAYRPDSAIRYSSTRSELRTYDIAPSLAYSFGNGFSIGAGADFVHAFAQLDTNIGFVPAPNFADGFREDKAENWGVGGHLGLLYEFSDCTRIGFNYRSSVKINARGETIQQVSATAPFNVVQHYDLRTSTRLPATAVISAFHQFNDCFALMGDIQWTEWKTFKTLALQDLPPGGNQTQNGTQTLNTNFKNSMRYALGAQYQFDECWLFRVGTAYDETPVVNDDRTTRIPDSNRYWLALGGRYSITPCLNLDFGYSHVFFRNAVVNDKAPTASAGAVQGRQNLRGTVRSCADLLGIQITWDLA